MKHLARGLPASTAIAAAIVAGCFAASASASGPVLSPSPAAPKSCGVTKSGTYVIRVSATTSCAFGRATYKAFAKDPIQLAAAVAKNFTLTVGSRTMDCRANPLAHGEFDIYCNDLNYYGTRVVDLVNHTEP